MATGKYFNRKVMALESPHVGYIVREVEDKIIIFGDYNYRFNVPKSGIIEVSRNVILNVDFSEPASKYNVDRNARLPIGEPIDKINDDAYCIDMIYSEQSYQTNGWMKLQASLISITQRVSPTRRPL